MKDNKTVIYQIFKLTTYFVILFSVLTIFQYYFTLNLGGISFYLLLIIPTITSLIFFKDTDFDLNSKKMLLSFFIWVSIYILNIQFLENYKYSISFSGLEFNVFTIHTIEVLCIVIIYAFISNNELNTMKKKIYNIILFSLFVNSIITLYALKIDPMIAKSMSTGIEEYNTFGLKGVSGYSIIYSIVIVLPLLYYAFSRYKRLKKLFMLVYINLMFYLVYKAGFLIALVAVIFGWTIYLFLNSSKLTKILLSPIILFILVFAFDRIIIYNLFIFLSKNITVNDISLRLKQLADFILYNDISGDSLYRFVLYKQSVDAFIKSPIFGIYVVNPNYELSRHSALMDILGGTGIIGFIPYILFIWYSFKNSIRGVNNKRLVNAIKTSYLVFIFIGLLDTLATSMTIMIIFLFINKFLPFYMESITKKALMKIEEKEKI